MPCRPCRPIWCRPSSRPRTRTSAPSRRRPVRPGPCHGGQHQEPAARPPARGRVDHHPAGGQEPAADQRGQRPAQDARAGPGLRDRAQILQGPDPGDVPQRDLPRPGRLWRRRGLGPLFRQAAGRAVAVRGGVPGGAAEGAEQLQPDHPARGRPHPPRLRAGPHGPGRRHHRRAGGRRQGRAAGGARPGAAGDRLRPYFAEEVRRSLRKSFGNDQLYRGGLAVRTTLDPRLQLFADRALRTGLERFDRNRGWRGPITNISAMLDLPASAQAVAQAEAAPGAGPAGLPTAGAAGPAARRAVGDGRAPAGSSSRRPPPSPRPPRRRTSARCGSAS